MKGTGYIAGFIALGIALALAGPVARAEDLAGSKDHPLVSRYEGAAITKYKLDKFDEYKLVLGKFNGQEVGEHQKIEGQVVKIVYEIDKSRSTLEVYKNYESALTSAGFEILWSCSNEDCGGLDFSYGIHGGALGGWPDDHRYLAAKLSRPEGTAYVSLYIRKFTDIGGPMKDTVYASLNVVESKEMETDKVKVDAEAIGKGLDAEGHIAIYGIYFDSGSDKLKPESDEALGEIASLMKSRAELKLLVVGHTDNQGNMDYNMDLSRRRAASVVAALAEKFGIAGDRLTPAGVGFLSPVASNRGDEGRAQNRRVELVER